jgi:hypothetical protein
VISGQFLLACGYFANRRGQPQFRPQPFLAG